MINNAVAEAAIANEEAGAAERAAYLASMTPQEKAALAEKKSMPLPKGSAWSSMSTGERAFAVFFWGLGLLVLLSIFTGG